MKKKFELTDETREVNGVTVYRIRALRDVGYEINAGRLGGFVSAEHVLSHRGDCWISGNAVVMGSSCVRDNARIKDSAHVYDSHVSGRAIVGYCARVESGSHVCDNSRVLWHSVVQGNSQIVHGAILTGDSIVRNAYVSRVKLADAFIESTSHVLDITGWLGDYSVTVYRTTTGHVINVGCQTFDLNADFHEIAARNCETLPEDWGLVRKLIESTISRWH